MSGSLPIVVFGAAGGLGRRVLAAMPEGHEVIPVDRALDAGGDLADPSELRGLARRLPERLIGINVMGAVSTSLDADAVAASVRDNVQSVGVIVSGLGERLAHLVHLSSISVYGPSRENPVAVDHPLRPETVYGVTKSAGELLVGSLCASLGSSLSIIRATQLFALPSAEQALPHVLARRLRAGESPRLTADPATRRDYLHVDDAARLVVQAGVERRAGTFNAGSGEGVLLGDLFAAAYEAAGRSPEPAGGGEDSSQWLDISETRSAFGWTPRESVLDWVRTQVRATT